MIVNSWIEIQKGELSRREWNKLFQQLTYLDANGELYQPWRFLVRKRAVRIPRGAWSLVPDHVEYVDKRSDPYREIFDFKVELDATLDDGRKFSGQHAALEAMKREEQGLVILPPGAGKTQIALAFCAWVDTSCLIIVHTEDILNQWIEYAKVAIPDAHIGVIRQEEFEIGDVTITTVQTFIRRFVNEPEIVNLFGAVILDEAHHAPAKTFELVLNNMPARYRFGLTATQMRADGKHPYMKTVIGPVIYKKKFESPVEITVRPLKSHFNYRYRGPRDWGSLVRALIADEDRNRMIAYKVDEEIRLGNSVIVLSRRIDQLENIMSFMEEKGELLAAKKRSKMERISILAEFKSGKLRCVLATQLADEAVDIPILSRVFLVHPGKAEGRIIQQVGRAIREHPGKEDAIIYDVVDKRVGVLRRQWEQRRRAYRRMGIRLGIFQWR